MTETVAPPRRRRTPGEPPLPPRRHLLGISDLDRDGIERLLGTAATIARSLDREVKKLPALRGRLVVNLFYESSTRTLSSFDLAAKRLSADTMALRSSGSSVDKGESLKDTALTLAEYDPDVIVIRHPHIGAPQLVAEATHAHVVNAGDGKHQHPTQALLDLYTMREALGRLDGLHVAIVGDVLHSRVARSLIEALALVGARTTLVGPPTLMPRGIEQMGCEVSSEIGDIAAADVVYVLRMQRERMLAGAAYVPSLREYAAEWGITPATAPAGPDRDAPRADEPRRRDRPAGRRLGRLADHGAGPLGARRPHGGALRPPRRRPRRRRPGPGGRMTLFWPDGPGDSLTIRGARVIDPASGLDGAFDVTIEDGIITARRARRSRRPAGSCSRRPSSTRTSTSGCPAARTRRRSPPARRRRRPAATARSSRCRTPTPSSTPPPCSAR